MLLSICLVTIFSCDQPTPKDLNAEALIPKPTSVVATGSSFAIKESTSIYVSDETLAAGEFLSEMLRPATGFTLEIKQQESKPSRGVLLYLIKGSDLGEEGYELNVTEKLVELRAHTEAGLIRGIQTIRQLLPPTIEAESMVAGPWEIASGTVTDIPEFSYRGAMLDVARHFFSVADVKQYIDYLAFFKMNALHLHLTDDQGWRIEIKSWPKLTTHGGSTEVGGGPGGFYTQEDYKEIVSYAAKRHIMIIPEIDMPGHTNAALSSYAELNCDGNATKLYTGTKVGFSTFCTQKDITYTFINDVIGELAAMTPGPYIHIGGDESHVTKLEDYIPFVNRVKDIVSAHGKSMIGWDEVAQANLDGQSVVQLWNSPDFARMAVEKGAKVIMSPAKRAYLDMQYDSTTQWGLHWAAYIEVDDGYNWDPELFARGVDKESILGVESPLWSETVTNMDEIEYMTFPRLAGYSEIGWSGSDRNWDEYKTRLARFDKRFEAMDINYYRSARVWENPNSRQTSLSERNH
ncbi:MAG: beta-N-acetylhexosaminidase [Roseivirga sp.]